jgi:Protein of unknown function (DUF2845)
MPQTPRGLSAVPSQPSRLGPSAVAIDHRPMRRQACRPTAIVRVVVVVLMATMGGALGQAWALDCDGRLVSEGQAPWEVQAICGEPTQVQDSVDLLLQPVYDPFGRVVDHLPVAVPKSVWTYNFGPSRLVYRLTFRDGKLVRIETGGYGY